MRKEITEIFQIILQSQQTPTWVVESRKTNEELEAIVLGKDYHTLLNKVEKRESEEQLKVRQKYSRSIVDIIDRVLRPVDNVYCATGGVIDVEVNNKEKFFKFRSKARNSISLTKWLDSNWSRELYNTDPNGLIWWGVKNKLPYITYKSIQTIRNYESLGQNVEWVLFEPNKTKEGKNEWRFVDDKYDYTILEHGKDSYEIVARYDNTYSIVPACIISDLEEFGTESRLPKIHKVVPLLKEFLKDTSIKTIFKQLHGFPIFWRYAVACHHCKGSGIIDAVKCPHCDGQGYYVRKDIADAVILPVPSSENAIKLAPDMAGYVVPPIEIWEQYNKELELLEAIIYETLWGDDQNRNNQQQTVVEIVRNTQPVINALNRYSDSAELIDQTLSEILAKYVYPTAKGDIVTVSYGRNFILETTSDILIRYKENRQVNMTTSILDKDLMDWLYTRFRNNPILLEQEKKRLYIEPHPHYTLAEVRDTMGNEETIKKMVFSDWWIKYADKSREKEQLQADFLIYLLTIKTTENAE